MHPLGLAENVKNAELLSTRATPFSASPPLLPELVCLEAPQCHDSVYHERGEIFQARYLVVCNGNPWA